MSAASLSQKNRITGGLVDRDQPLGFRFDRQHYTGFAGDTLASALLANDVRLVGRSFKYHRPRGILTAGSEEPNALVTIGDGAHQEAVRQSPPSGALAANQQGAVFQQNAPLASFCTFGSYFCDSSYPLLG